MTFGQVGESAHNGSDQACMKAIEGRAVTATGMTFPGSKSRCSTQVICLKQTSGKAGLLNRLKSLPVKSRTKVQAIVHPVVAVGILMLIAGRPGSTIG